MRQLSAQNREAIRPLFVDYPYLHGLVQGVLSGALGQALADQTAPATVGMLVHDFVLFAGDASCPTAAEMICSRSSGSWLVGVSSAWRERFVELWGDQLRQKECFALRAAPCPT